MARNRDVDAVEQATQAIEDLLARAVQATIDDRSPDPARQAAGELADLDARSAPQDRSGPAQLIAMLMLVRRLSLVRDELADRPQRVPEVLAWVEDALGTRCRLRARFVAGVLESRAGAEETAERLPALEAECVPALIWLLAGAVALHGGGETQWLRTLESSTPAQ